MDTKTETAKTKEVAKPKEIIKEGAPKSSVASYTPMASHTLETSKDTEQAVIEFLNANPTISFKRRDITEALSHANLSPKAKEHTKGGDKTGKGKPRWVKNVAWAIQTLTKKGMIKKTGKNAYGHRFTAFPS